MSNIFQCFWCVSKTISLFYKQQQWDELKQKDFSLFCYRKNKHGGFGWFLLTFLSQFFVFHKKVAAMVLGSYVVPRCVTRPKRIAKFACLLMSRISLQDGGGALWSKIVGMLKNIFTNRWSCVVCASLLIFYSTQLARLQSCFVPHSIHNMHAFHTSHVQDVLFCPAAPNHTSILLAMVKEIVLLTL